MIIYKHEMDGIDRVRTIEIEVFERPNAYRTDTLLILKSDIGKLRGIGDLSYRMYTLTPDNTPFIKALIKEKETAIENTKRCLERDVAKKAALLKLLEEKEAAAHGDPIPAADSGEI